MRKRSGKKVIDTNIHLKDPKARALGIARTVQTSSAVEGIYVDIQTYFEDGEYHYKVKSAHKKESS